MKGRILLVDDNEDFLDSTRDVLEIEGYEVVTATSGEAAVALAAAESFDLILMDIKMPGMNGVESFIEMKKSNPRIEVIMATAYSVQDLISQALQEGARAVLQKPLDMGKLFKTIGDIRSKGAGGFVLIADDDLALCDSLKDGLTLQGYDVCTANDAEEVIKKAESHQFDVLLLDMKLPILNGLEVYRQVKAMQPDIIAVVISGYALEMSELINQTLQESAHAFLRKPVDMHALLGILNDICTAKRSGNYKKNNPPGFI
ncbi:MAG: response regulator [Deltaproteobacteria bacterium]|nr:response regulator [Deltaproteobacteria bacterium]